jgi:hypothetical protein
MNFQNVHLYTVEKIFMCAKFETTFLFCILASIQLHQQLIHKHIHADGYYPWTYKF